MATTQGIKLDSDLQQRLKALSAARNRSAHWLMKAAIENYLDREERYEAEKNEDMLRFEHYQLTGIGVDQLRVEKWLKDLSLGKPAQCPK